MGFEPRPPDCSGCKVSGLQHVTITPSIDLLAILKKSLDRAIFLYSFIHEIRKCCVRASIAIINIRTFYK